jgi:hypothetical protein
MNQSRHYQLLMDKHWQLDDLYEFPHAFAQTYAFIYCLDSELNPRHRERIKTALLDYPWKGGYSYVNIYSVLRSQVPREDRPEIHSRIQVRSATTSGCLV